MEPIIHIPKLGGSVPVGDPRADLQVVAMQHRHQMDKHCSLAAEHDCTVKVVRGKISFDSQNDKYASQLSCNASPEAYLSLRVTVKRICHLVNAM
jgi:hypothetical protein